MQLGLGEHAANEVRGIESDDEDETFGVEGMTVQLLELLATLVAKHGVRDLVRQGMVPLASTVSSYMILSQEQDELFRDDPN